MEQLEEETYRIVQDATLTEQLLQYSNRYRSFDDNVQAAFNKSLYVFEHDYDYAQSLEIISKALDLVEPGVTERFVTSYEKTRENIAFKRSSFGNFFILSKKALVYNRGTNESGKSIKEMKKIKKYITFIILGGVAVLSIALMNGWRLDDYTIPKNRTREQYDFEGTFESMFKFLEQEKKDFTGLKLYTSSVYVKDGDEVKEYEVYLDTTQSDIKGDYTITIGDNKETVPVTYSNDKLTYSSEISPLFDEEILNLVVQRNHFESLNVKETLIALKQSFAILSTSQKINLNSIKL